MGRVPGQRGHEGAGEVQEGGIAAGDGPHGGILARRDDDAAGPGDGRVLRVRVTVDADPAAARDDVLVRHPGLDAMLEVSHLTGSAADR